MTRRRTGEPFDAARVEALWNQQIEQGTNTAAFCAAQGLDIRTYNRWKGQLMTLRSNRPPSNTPTPPPDLVDVTNLLAPPPSSAGVEVILPDGTRLRLTPGFDPATLRRAVEALR